MAGYEVTLNRSKNTNKNMDYINKIIELGFATGQGKGNEAFKELFAEENIEERESKGILSVEINKENNL